VTGRHSSNTAFGAAMMRAVHQLIDEEPKILDDPMLRLLDASILDQIRLNPNAGAASTHHDAEQVY
jgi:hypothetical protein